MCAHGRGVGSEHPRWRAKECVECTCVCASTARTTQHAATHMPQDTHATVPSAPPRTCRELVDADRQRVHVGCKAGRPFEQQLWRHVLQRALHRAPQEATWFIHAAAAASRGSSTRVRATGQQQGGVVAAAAAWLRACMVQVHMQRQQHSTLLLPLAARARAHDNNAPRPCSALPPAAPVGLPRARTLRTLSCASATTSSARAARPKSASQMAPSYDTSRLGGLTSRCT